MDKFEIYVTLIFIVKFVFIVLAISRLYIKNIKPDDKKLLEKIEFWKDRVEFIFIAMMSVMLIYIFNPRANRINMISGETKVLLYLFGFVLLITAKWSLFIKESPVLINIQKSVGK